MSDNSIQNFAERQDWLQPLGEKSDALVNSVVQTGGEVGETAKDVLINSRILGHKRHPTITDVPFGSWTVTLVSDLRELAGQKQQASTDLSLIVGLVASLLAAAGGLADLSETGNQTDRRLGMMHGIFQGFTLALYGGSLAARRTNRRKLGQCLSFVGYGTLVTASYLAGQLKEHRR